jgi:hypothetical protein
MYSFTIVSRTDVCLAIIGTDIENPNEGAENNWKVKFSRDELPDLGYVSDIYWGYWFKDHPNVKNLRLYGIHNVVNDDTALLIARVLSTNKIDLLQRWPGHTFDHLSADGLVLMGSPIGRTMAHLIVGHKAELGVKRIHKIMLSTNDPMGSGKMPNHRDLHMFFHIEDVPQDSVAKRASEAELSGIYVESRILHVRNEGRNLVSKHVFRL